MTDPSSLPYAKWLEASLQNVASKPVESICILVKREDGEILTGYYNCTVSDKLLFAGYVNQDAMIDSLHVGGYIVGEDDDADDTEEDGDGYDEEDSEEDDYDE